MIDIYVQRTRAKACADAPITSGSVGLVARFRFSEEWEELNKIAIFETDNYKEPVEIPEAGEVVVPDSVLVYPWTQLRVGVRGESEDGHVVIPTVYADCGTISLGANTTPAGTPPTPSQAEYLQAQIDELRESGVGGGITEETDPTVPAWAKAPEKPSYTAEEVGALPVGTEIPVVPATLPNPHKLTFSGAVSAEYDGSEAVEVVIPQGGGGSSGGGSNEWVTVMQETLTEDTASIYVTDGGFPFNELLIYINGASDGTHKSITFFKNGGVGYGNNLATFENVMGNTSSMKGYCVFHVTALKNQYKIECNANQYGNAIYNTSIQWFTAAPGAPQALPDTTKIENICFAPWSAGAAGIFPAGTVIGIYGRG